MLGGRFAAMLGVVTLVALAGRVGYIGFVTSRDRVPPIATTRPGHQMTPRLARSWDEYYYQGMAGNLANGRGFAQVGNSRQQDALHPPLTSVLLVPTERYFSDNDIVSRLPVALAGAGTVALVGIVGAGIAGRRAGLISAALAAVYPNLWMHDGLLMSESFSALLTIAVIYCTYRLIRTPSYLNAAAFGIGCGLAMLTRSELVLLLPLLIVPTAMIAFRPGQRLRLTATAVVAALLLVTPWLAYNLSRFDKPVLISYGDASTLLGANCDTTYHGKLVGTWDGYCSRLAHPREVSVDAATQRSQAFRYISHHLGDLPRVLTVRVARVWGLYQPITMLEGQQLEGKPLRVTVPGYVMYWPLVVLAVYGAMLLRRRRTPLYPLIVPAVIVTLVAAAFYGLLRNRVSAEVAIVVLAGIALDRFWSQIHSFAARRRSHRPRADTERRPVSSRQGAGVTSAAIRGRAGTG